MRRLDRLLWSLTALALGACGGGGGGGGGMNNPPPSGWTPGVFEPYTSFDALCVNPRTGIDPFTGDPFPDRPSHIHAMQAA